MSADEACLSGPISVSRTIVAALGARHGAGFKVSIVPVWLALSYLAVCRGWMRTASRLLLGFAVTLIFAFLPYFLSLPAFGNFAAPECQPFTSAGVCGLFDGNGGLVYLMLIVWLTFAFPIGFWPFSAMWV